MDNSAIDSLRLAYERTTLSWVRTSLSLIGFGFTIDKLFEAQTRQSGGNLVEPRVIGLSMIGFGLIALLLFVVDLRRFHAKNPQVPRSGAGILALLIGILGITALVFSIFT